MVLMMMIERARERESASGFGLVSNGKKEKSGSKLCYLEVIIISPGAMKMITGGWLG